MEGYIISSSPHLHSGASTRGIMTDVVIALIPAVIASAVIFGPQALIISAVCVISAVLGEGLFNILCKRPQTIGDMSAVVTGLLLGLNLSTNVPLWQCAVGSLFAVVVVKCLFGGLGHNFANPAITGRVFMLLAFSQVAGGAAPVIAELTTSATPLEIIPKDMAALPSLWDMFIGLHGGAVGETCVAALLVGYIYLVIRKVIKWYVPAAFVGTVFVLFLAFTGSFTTALYEVLAGGLFLGAVFMATDYVTTPVSNRGKVIFCVGCGVITFVIRHFCAYPEGVSFSILIMNLFTPLIEKYTKNLPLGGTKIV